jgi:GH24 family phage-related lysozyme (muramidase)
MNKLTSTFISIAVITLLLAIVIPASAASDTTVLSGNAKNVASVSEMKQVTSKLQNSLESRSYSVNDASVTTIDFENIPEWTSVTDQYKDQGVTFSEDTPILAEGQSLNYGGYPPCSGINVVGPQSTGIIQANFITSISNVEVYYWSKYDIQLEAYDKNNKLIKTITGEPDTTGYEHGQTMYNLSISNTPGIASVIIRGTPGYYIIDDFSFNGGMKLSDKGIKFITSHEGCPTRNGLAIMYNDPVGHCTIGYGHLIHLGPIDGRDSEKPYKNGITLDQARELFRNDAAKYEEAVNDNVKVPLTQYQFDALVSFTYNIGINGFKSSSVLTVLNRGSYDAVPGEIMLYNKVTDPKTHKKVVNKGLVKRRTDEANLFKKGTY